MGVACNGPLGEGRWGMTAWWESPRVLGSGKALLSAVHTQDLSRIQLFATPWTVAPQVPLSMELFTQEYRFGSIQSLSRV